MTTDPLDLVASTADPAFGTDENGRIVIWNRAAEKLFGYEASDVLGRPCHDIICGRDPFGNRFCDEVCPLANMVRRREAVRRFQMDVRLESNQLQRVSVSVLTVPGPRESQFTMLHLLQPVKQRDSSGDWLTQLGEGTGDEAAAAGAAGSAASSPPRELASLTPRELEILRLLTDGSSNKKIADSLYISVMTVRTHVQNILRKLEVHSKVEAVALALRHRLI